MIMKYKLSQSFGITLVFILVVIFLFVFWFFLSPSNSFWKLYGEEVELDTEKLLIRKKRYLVGFCVDQHISDSPIRKHINLNDDCQKSNWKPLYYHKLTNDHLSHSGLLGVYSQICIEVESGDELRENSLSKLKALGEISGK